MRTAATLAAAALLLGAEAACPNQCSGHGYCDENDRCICFRGPGTKGQLRDTWTGYDCSQRVCPFGDSHDYISDATMEFLEVNAGSADPYVGFIPAPPPSSGMRKLKAFLNNGFLLKRDTGLDVKVVSVDTQFSVGKFQWKLSSQKTFNAEESFSTSMFGSKEVAYQVRPDTDGDGVAEDSGLFLYWDMASGDLGSVAQKVFAGDRYYLNVTWNEGKNLQLTDLNTAHPGMECSGRGNCDRSSGTCKCVAGFTGDACQRTACAKDCNGHGTCQSLQYFVQEGTAGLGPLDYTGVDAEQQFGCKCDSGFRGYDCSKAECPSGPDPLGGQGGAEGQDCSGRGMCDYTSGTCRCFKGYFGERCEELSTLV